MTTAALVFWYFLTYVGTDWENPVRVFSVYGPFGSEEDCVARMHDHWEVEGSLQKSPCFASYVVRKARG